MTLPKVYQHNRFGVTPVGVHRVFGCTNWTVPRSGKGRHDGGDKDLLAE